MNLKNFVVLTVYLVIAVIFVIVMAKRGDIPTKTKFGRKRCTIDRGALAILMGLIWPIIIPFLVMGSVAWVIGKLIEKVEDNKTNES
jgi:hypothetical protein